MFLIFAREADGQEGELVGGTGLHRIDWSLRRFEIGYWRKTGCEGRGIVTEATRAMARLAFDPLGARRVELRMDDNNERSWKVAERAGFTLEALLRFDALNPRGEPRSTRVYARVRGAEEPFGPNPPLRKIRRRPRRDAQRCRTISDSDPCSSPVYAGRVVGLVELA